MLNYIKVSHEACNHLMADVWQTKLNLKTKLKTTDATNVWQNKANEDLHFPSGFFFSSLGGLMMTSRPKTALSQSLSQCSRPRLIVCRERLKMSTVRANSDENQTTNTQIFDHQCPYSPRMTAARRMDTPQPCDYHCEVKPYGSHPATQSPPCEVTSPKGQ